MSTDALRDQIRAQVRTALGAGRAKDDPASVAALMRRFEQGYEMVSAEAIVACFAPDVVWTLPDSRVLRGREACLAFLKERFASPSGPKFWASGRGGAIACGHHCASRLADRPVQTPGRQPCAAASGAIGFAAF